MPCSGRPFSPRRPRCRSCRRTDSGQAGGDYKLAFGDIFGGNAFLPVLLLLAVVVSGKSVLPNAHATDLYLTGLGGLLTIVYMDGLLFRPQKQHARLGIDSIAVLVLYVVGVAGLIAYPADTTNAAAKALAAADPSLGMP